MGVCMLCGSIVCVYVYVCTVWVWVDGCGYECGKIHLHQSFSTLFLSVASSSSVCWCRLAGVLLGSVLVGVLYVVVRRRKQGEGAVIELEKSPSWL